MKLVKRVIDFVFSWMKPIRVENILETSTGQTYTLDKTKDDKYRSMSKYAPWPDSYFVLVSVQLKDKTNEESPLLYRFYDPVSNKEFVIDEALKNILFYKQ